MRLKFLSLEKPAAWSCIRLVVVVSTKVALVVISEGNWEHELFPEPVVAASLKMCVYF